MKPGAVLAGLGLVAEPTEAKPTLAHFAALRAQVPGGIVAWQPQKALACKPSARHATASSSGYHEQATAGGWNDEQVTVARDGDTWIWLDGDSPRCAVKPEKLN